MYKSGKWDYTKHNPDNDHDKNEGVTHILNPCYKNKVNDLECNNKNPELISDFICSISIGLLIYPKGL
ncbi:hypothetical protein Pecwa_2016 [Pectobacterium parmentieri WPP163]|nr:hypothetical protein Pecwa_2016 [Pectobacterium parmentieri WPP163]